MSEVKKAARDAEAVRSADGTSPKDRVGNAGDTVRKGLGNAGDAARDAKR